MSADAGWRLELLGGFSLARGARPVEVLPGSQRILALLALRGGRVSRRTVRSVLWPDADGHRAAASLRTALWRMPGADDLVATDGEQLSLHPHVTCDVDELIDDDPADRPALRSELLPAWYDDWVLVERERFHHRRVEHLKLRVTALLADGRHGQAVDVAIGAVAAEPLRESAHRLLIDAHLAEGNVVDARRARDAYVERLSADLGIEPSRDFVGRYDSRLGSVTRP